nr:putative reverse transcriptase domain-containing protein [Tanacetum cinerariifolium]
MLTKSKFFYDHITKEALGFQNPFYIKKAQQLKPKLYDGNVIKNNDAIMIFGSEETLMLVEQSHSKLLLKQKDPMMLKKKVNTTPVDYAILNQLSQDFEKQFVPQTKLSTEQVFWSQNSINSSDPTPSNRPTKVKVPKELPKVSMVNTSLKKLKHHLAGFDVVFKERTTATALTEELVLLCTKMVLEEEDQVENFIGGLPNNIRGNVIVVDPTRLQDAVRIAKILMDQKLKGYAARNAENKRRFNNNSRYNQLASFDVIVGMDLLSRYHTVIIYDEKVVRIPYGNEVLEIQGDGCSGGDKSRLIIISCTKTHKYIHKGCQVFLAQVMEKKVEDKSEEKRLEDVPTVRDFLEVFPKDFPGLSPTRKVKFQIDLVWGVTAIAQSPYRLTPLEMQELYAQLKELSDT